MDDEFAHTTEQWFHSTYLVLNESYQLDLRRLLSPNTCELIQVLSDFYMYDYISLFTHLLGVTSHYLTSTSLVYADNQLRHKLNLHILLVARTGYERSSIVEHIKQAMNNVQSIRQTGKIYDNRSTCVSNAYCRLDDTTSPSSSFCLSDKFDEHKSNAHLQQHQSSSILGTSNGYYIQQLLHTKFTNKKIELHTCANWLMVFIASKARLFCRRLKVIDPNRYPSIEQWIIVINCLCSSATDFYFDEPQANQFLCDFIDGLSLKAISLEETHPWMAARYLSAQDHVIRASAAIRIMEMAIEILIIYKRTFHTFGQADKIFFDNCNRIIEQTRSTSITKRVHISLVTVQSAIYLVNTSIKQFEVMFEPTLSTGTPNPDLSTSGNQSSTCDHPWMIRSSSPFPPQSISPTSSKRLKPMVDPSYLKSLELAHELLLLPFVAFTRTSVYANSKLKRNAAYLDCVIDELKKYQLLIIVRQGVQMVDGTRRRVDLLVKCAPMLRDTETNNNEARDNDLLERLKRFGVEYDHYIQTLGTLDIGEKYRLSEQCFDLLNSSDYKRYLTIDLERIAPLHRVQQQEETNELWVSPTSSTPNIKVESADCHA